MALGRKVWLGVMALFVAMPCKASGAPITDKASAIDAAKRYTCLLYTSPSPRD